MKKSFATVFQYRTVMCLICFCVLLLLGFVRVICICTDVRATSVTANRVTVELSSGRGNIYDCKGKKLTSVKDCYAVVFLPCEQAMLRFAEETEGEQREAGLAKLRNKKPVVIRREEKITGVGIYSFPVSERYGEIYGLEHLIGYVNAENRGVTGLEKEYDELLYSDSGYSAAFSVDASGNFLLGDPPETIGEASVGAVYLTIDKELQQICYEAAQKLEKGAVVLTEISSGKIRAMVSRPGFEISRVSDYMEDANAPLINRALRAYSVGSVFKPLVAAALLETGQSGYCYRCTGYCDILSIRFYCNHRDGHGDMDLKTALAKSCNTYFYNAAGQVKPSALNDLAAAFGFTGPVRLTDGIAADRGSMTDLKTLERSKAAVANFAIGQGNIALSPLVLCNMYAVIANDGAYYAPTLIEGLFQKERYEPAKQGDKNVVISSAAAAVLKEDLIGVVEQGTGSAAKPSAFGAGGKTATAQTGQLKKDGTEVLNAWFCGFFPAQQPEYVLTVLAEDASAGGSDAAPIFREIADGINALQQEEELFLKNTCK